VQQRCLRATKSLPAGHVLTADDVEALRPATPDALKPYLLNNILGQKIQQPLEFGDPLMTKDFQI
jgi:N-acetylneuraminate synthase